MWLLAHQKRNLGIVESHRSIHHLSSGRVSHHLFSLFSLFLEDHIYIQREGGKISIASHLKDIVRGRTRLQRYVQCKKSREKGRNKETKDFGWLDERDNKLYGRERGKWCLKKQINVCADYRYSFSSFSHWSFLVVSNWFTDPVSTDGRQQRILYGRTLKKGRKSHIFFFGCLPNAPPSFPKRWANWLCVRPSCFWIFIIIFPKKTNSILAFLFISSGADYIFTRVCV